MSGVAVAGRSREDQVLIASLQARYVEQQRELESRTAAIAQIQSNVEKISVLCDQKQTENARLKAHNERLEAEVNKLRSEKSSAITALAEQNQVFGEAKAEWLKTEKTYRSTITQLQQGLLNSYEELRVLKSTLATTRADMGALHESTAHDMRHISATADRLHKQDMQKDVLHSQSLQKFQAEVASLRLQLENLQLTHSSTADAHHRLLEEQEAQNQARLGALEAAIREQFAARAEGSSALEALQMSVEKLCTENRQLTMQLQNEQETAKSLRHQLLQQKAEHIGGQMKYKRECDEVINQMRLQIVQQQERIEQIQHLERSQRETRIERDALLEEVRELGDRVNEYKRVAEEQTARLQLHDDSSKLLRKMEQEVWSSVTKLLTAQEAMEGSFTCAFCLELLNEPVTMVPCGHSFCRSCVSKMSKEGGGSGENVCVECGSSSKSIACVRNTLLDALSGKFVFCRQVLATMKTELATSRTASSATIKREGAGPSTLSFSTSNMQFQ